MPINTPDRPRAGDVGRRPSAPHFAGRFAHPPRVVFHRGQWWDWTTASPHSGPGFYWRPIVRSVECAAWSDPVTFRDGGRIAALAHAELDAAHSQPVTMELPGAGRLLFTRESGIDVIRQCTRSVGTLGELAPPPTTYVREPHPRGEAGRKKSTNAIRDQILRDMVNPTVIENARQVVHDAGAAEPRGWPEPQKIVDALFVDQKKRASFVKDPNDTELVGATVEILCLDPKHRACWRAGDCDDQLVAMGSRLATLGIPVALRTRKYAGEDQGHVTLLYDASIRSDGTDWRCIDPSTSSGKCSDLPYESEILMYVSGPGQHGPSGGQFIGVGQPPGASPGSGAIGATGSDALTPEESGNMIAALDGVGQNLADALARLVKTRASYVAIRKSLGLPDFDDPQGGQSPGLPLEDYKKTLRYTKDVAAQEDKLIATAAFAVQAVQDGVSGRRSVEWDPSATTNGHLWIASRPGDPYRLRIVQDAAGNDVLEWLDPASDQSLGQVGVAPAVIIVGIVAAAVITIAATVAVWKIVDYVQAAHADDAINKVGDATDKRLTSGTTTPEQEIKLLEAQARLAEAIKPKPPSDQPLIPSWVWTLGAVVAGGALALVIVRAGLFSFVTKGGAQPFRFRKKKDDDAGEWWSGARERSFFLNPARGA